MTEAEREEAYEQANDAERGAQLIDARGEIISADSIRARMSAQAQHAVDAGSKHGSATRPSTLRLL